MLNTAKDAQLLSWEGGYLRIEMNIQQTVKAIWEWDG